MLVLASWLLPAAGLWAQTSSPASNLPASNPGGPMPLAQKDVEQLATRMLQLMESTAVAVPGLIRASEPVKQNADETLAAIERTPRNPALTYRFINQIKAYLALSDSFPRPYPFPAAADQQFAELREGLQRMQLHFEATLETQTQIEQKRDSDPNNLKRYADADSKMLPPAAKVPRVVFLGDSITDAWRLNEYFTGRDFVNRGIGGQTTLQMLARFRQDVAALNPKAVVILGGTNDIAAGISVNQIEDNLAMMGELAKAHGIRPIFASILPVSDYHKDADPHNEITPGRPPATILSINNWMRGYCQSQGFPYMDYYSVMVDSAGRLQSDLSDDGLHPNAKGYRVMSPVALEGIGRAMSGQPDGPEPPAKRRFRLLGQ
jgi:lysophospholipase L1-like esterase